MDLLYITNFITFGRNENHANQFLGSVAQMRNHGCYLYFLYTHITPQLSLNEVGIILLFTSEETEAQGVPETSKGVKILSSKAGVST